MNPLIPRPGLTEQVYQSLLDEICDGVLAPGTHLVQENLAATLNVSRQPIQQALAMLKNDGLVQELGRRGLFVVPLEPTNMQHHYEIRAALDGLAARRAAERAGSSRDIATAMKSEGAALLAAGHSAIAGGQFRVMVKADVAFHDFIYAASDNPLIAPTAAMHWRQMRRVMGQVLRHAESPETIWRQHAEILAAIVAGDPLRAESAATNHVRAAANRLELALEAMAHPSDNQAAAADVKNVRTRRTARSMGG